MQPGVDLWGGDYRNFELREGTDGSGRRSEEVCRATCEGEAQCMAWTWVKPTRVGQRARCWLKNTVPAARQNERCISGVSRRARRFTEVTAQTGRGIEQVRVAARGGSLQGASVLESFKLRFTNSDHKLRRMGVLAENRFARFAFADQDNNDPFEANATWWTTPRGVSGSVSGVSRNRAVVELPEGPALHTLVLTGFDVWREERTDANIRTFGVAMDSDARTATVVVSDDMGTDWRGFEATLGIATILAFVPIDAGLAVTATAIDAADRLNGGFAAGPRMPGRPYAFTVQYAWIPNDLIAKPGAQSGSQQFERTRFDSERPWGRIGLQSFMFTFGNSDHHLEEIKIDLVQRGIADGATARPVMFRDGDFDDPMQWAVEYVQLEEQ